MGKELSFMLFFMLIISFVPTISADVISLNSGGSGNIILNPDTYIEGFFFGPVCGNGVVDAGEQCDEAETDVQTCV
jgi:hypothetical protein